MTPADVAQAVDQVPRLLRTVPRWVTWPALLVLIAAAFSAGRFSGPAVESTRTEYTEIVKVKWKQAKTRDVVRYVKVVTLPDGTKTEESSTHLVSATNTSADTSTAITDTRTHTTQQLPDWRAGILIGATWKEPAVRLAGPLVVGGYVERRIIGGVAAGAWATTQGAAGASLSLSF